MRCDVVGSPKPPPVQFVKLAIVRASHFIYIFGIVYGRPLDVAKISRQPPPRCKVLVSLGTRGLMVSTALSLKSQSRRGCVV